MINRRTKVARSMDSDGGRASRQKPTSTAEARRVIGEGCSDRKNNREIVIKSQSILISEFYKQGKIV